MANQITANPSTFMSSLKKTPASAALNINQNSTIPSIKPGASLGVKASTPEQNIKPASNTLAPKQVQQAPTPTNKTFTEQENTGLLAALQRKNSGTANDADIKNLEYAQSKGWKAPTTPAPAVSAPATPVVKPVDTSSKGILTNLVQTGQQGANTSQQASQGLMQTAQVNPATSGQAYTDYQTAIDELNNIKNEYANEIAKTSGTGIPLEFQQGRQQVINNLYLSKLAAAQEKVNQAQTAIGQQITGTQTQQAGFTGAGGLGTSAQSLLGTAAGYAQPVQVPYGTQFVSPQTGESIGNIGSDMNNMINYWADQIANNKAGLADVPATITGAPNLKTQLQQAIQAKNPSYNPAVQGAGQQTAAELTNQTNQLQASLNGAEANFSLLVNTAQQGGVNSFDVPALNTLQQNVMKGLASNAAVINFQSTLATVRSQYAAILGGGTVTVDSQNRAQQAIPDNISLGALKSLEQQMKQEAQNRITGNQQQINSLTGGTSGSASSGSSIWNW